MSAGRRSGAREVGAEVRPRSRVARRNSASPPPTEEARRTWPMPDMLSAQPSAELPVQANALRADAGSHEPLPSGLPLPPLRAVQPAVHEPAVGRMQPFAPRGAQVAPDAAQRVEVSLSGGVLMLSPTPPLVSAVAPSVRARRAYAPSAANSTGTPAGYAAGADIHSSLPRDVAAHARIAATAAANSAAGSIAAARATLIPPAGARSGAGAPIAAPARAPGDALAVDLAADRLGAPRAALPASVPAAMLSLARAQLARVAAVLERPSAKPPVDDAAAMSENATFPAPEAARTERASGDRLGWGGARGGNPGRGSNPGRLGGYAVDAVGAALRRQRVARNMSLAEVSRTTRIPQPTLVAIEADQFDDLPGDVFVRGFLRAFAVAVGLSPDDILARYTQSRRATTVVAVPLAVQVKSLRGGQRRFGIAIACVLLLILFTLAVSIVLKPRGHDVPAQLSLRGAADVPSSVHALRSESRTRALAG